MRHNFPCQAAQKRNLPSCIKAVLPEETVSPAEMVEILKK